MLNSRLSVGSLWVTVVAAVGLVLGLVVAPAATASGAGDAAGGGVSAAAAAGANDTATGGAAASDAVAYINAQNTGTVIQVSASTGGANGDGHTCAVTTGNTVYCWGDNYYGQLGNGTSENKSWVPVKVADNVDAGFVNGQVSQVSAGGAHTCAVTDAGTGGTVYCWGRNNYEQLGNPTTGGKSAMPVQVKAGAQGNGDLSNVESVSAGSSHTCAVTTGGTVYCWGDNDSGQLGNDSTTLSRVPVKVVDENGFENGQVSQVSAGGSHTCAVTDGGTGGTVYCWGRNSYGQLGNGLPGFENNSSVPVKVVDENGFENGQVGSVSAGYLHTCAVTGGAAYCWGDNGYGQLGNKILGPDTCSGAPLPNCSKVPVKVVDENGFENGQVESVSAGGSSVAAAHTCAVTTGNTVYCWGRNNFGQLGNNSTPLSRVPVKVADNVDAGFENGQVESVSAGWSHTCAVTDAGTGGTVYCWGDNSFGQLGNGDESGPDKCKNDTPCSKVPVPVAGQLRVVPNPVEFGEVKVGLSETQDVQVTSTFLSPVGLDSVKEEGSKASFEWQVCEVTAAIVAVIDPGTGCVGRAVFAPEEPGSYAVSLLLEPYALNEQGQLTEKLSGSLEFSVSGNASCVKDCGPVVLGKPSPVDFGSVALGQIVTDSVRLVNDGDKTLRISKVTAADTDGEFSVVDPDECVDKALRPDQGCSMQVRFAPESAGSRAGVLEVTSNSKAKTNAIGLTGVGEAAVIAKPNKVRKLKAPKKKIKAKKARVKWKEPKGEATVTKYQTRIKKCKQKKNGKWNCKKRKWQKWKKKKPVANAKGWIKRDVKKLKKGKKLKPATRYKVQVRAKSGDIKGPKSRIKFKTKKK